MAPYKPYKINGVEYCRGNAGSLILACPKCGEEHFRSISNFFEPSGNPKWHKCYTCHTQMEAMRVDELQTRWYPLWKRLGFTGLYLSKMEKEKVN